jgi:hypothetical protein
MIKIYRSSRAFLFTIFDLCTNSNFSIFTQINIAKFMKNLLLITLTLTLTLTLISSAAICQSGAFTLQGANQTNLITINGTSYTDDLVVKHTPPAGKKFILVAGTIKEDVEIEVEVEAIYFQSADSKLTAVGEFTRGELKFRVSDLNTSWKDDFAYLFIVDEGVKSGSLYIGTEELKVSKIGDNWLVADKPKKIEYAAHEFISSYKAINNVEDQEDKEYKVSIEYSSLGGSFLVLSLNVLPPAKVASTKNGDSYNFNPKDFTIVDPSNSSINAIAFIRDGYDDNFSESMNNNLQYGREDTKLIQMVFPVGNSKTSYKIVHKGVEFGSFQVK